MDLPQQNAQAETGGAALTFANFFEWAKIIQDLSAIPALPMMLLLHKKVGFRRVPMTYVLFFSALTFFGGVFLRNPPLILAGLALFCMGYYQNIQAWLGICRGEPWHTYSPGYSWLEYIPFPPIITNEERINRFLDPLTGYLLTVILCYFEWTRYLGGLIFLSTLFLAIYAQQAYDYRLNKRLDIYDQQSDALAIASWTKQKTKQRLVKDSEFGIPTGIGSDIDRQIELRKRKVYEAQRETAAYTVPEDEAYTPPPTTAAPSYAYTPTVPEPPIQAVVNVAPEPEAATIINQTGPDNLA